MSDQGFNPDSQRVQSAVSFWELDLEELVVPTNLGSVVRGELEEDFEVGRAICSLIKKCPVSSNKEFVATVNAFLEVTSEYAQKSEVLRKPLGQLAKPAPELKAHWLQIKQNLRERLNSISKALTSSAVLFGWYAPVAAGAETDRVLKEGLQRLSVLTDEANATLAAIKSLRAEAEGMLTIASKAAKHNLVVAEAKHFNDEVARHRIAFGVWMACVAFTLFALSKYVLLFVEPELSKLPINSTAGDVLKHAIPRVIVFLGGYWLVLFLARSAASERHNWIVNQHRVNALRTYQTLMNATTDKRIQDAMLIQSSNTIFLPQSTGFLKEEVGQPADSPKIGDVVKVLVGNDRTSSGP